METKTIKVVVEMKLKADADVQETIWELDYEFNHANIVETEIIDVIGD